MAIQKLTGVHTFALAALMLAFATSSAQAEPTVEQFPTPTGTARMGIAAGPDGNMWFAGNGKIGRITPGGHVTEFTVGLLPGANPWGMGAGPDGNMWFTDPGLNMVGYITPEGVISEFPVTSPGAGPLAITAGPDGNMWFTEPMVEKIGKVNLAGVVTNEYAATGTDPTASITAGADGNLWYGGFGFSLGRMTIAGIPTSVSSDGQPSGIAAGPDGNLWSSARIQTAGTGITRITPGAPPTTTLFPFSPPGPGGSEEAIAAGPDGNFWLTSNGALARVGMDGTRTDFPAAPGGIQYQVAAGPDGNLWFTQSGSGSVGRVRLDPPAFSKPDPVNAGDSTTAAQYPSTLNVSGLQGTITDVKVRLTGVGHRYPSDLDVMLVGPGGQAVDLLSDAASLEVPTYGATLTFSDSAPFEVPNRLISGVYKPTDIGISDNFPPPAPAGDQPSSLAGFKGTDPNGTWQLFVQDDALGGRGGIFGGWGLDIETTGPPPASPAVSKANVAAKKCKKKKKKRALVAKKKKCKKKKKK